MTILIQLGKVKDPMEVMVQDFPRNQGERADHFYDIVSFTVPIK